MNVSAIICEYNPFHNGHKYLLEKMRQSGRADFCVLIMSGNFVQRGKPAMFDKFSRTRMALLGGADLVLELPLIFACSSAGEFASCAVSLALKTGIVDTLFFGTETDMSLTELRSVAALLQKAQTDPQLKKELRKGSSYPRAFSDVLRLGYRPQYALPNNILALSYLKALEGLDKTKRISPFPIKRTDAMSASYIREILQRDGPSGLKSIQDEIPASSFAVLEALMEGGSYAGNKADIALGTYLRLRLLDAKYGSLRPLEDFLDVSPEISSRLLELADKSFTFDEAVLATKTRGYTYGRISRALLHIVLGITKEESDKRKRDGYVSAIRILGFRREAAEKGLLKALKKEASCEIVEKPSSHERLVREDLFRNQLYYSLIPGLEGKSEYEHTPAIV